MVTAAASTAVLGWLSDVPGPQTSLGTVAITQRSVPPGGWRGRPEALIGAGEGRVPGNEASQRGHLHLFLGSCDGPHSGALVPQGLSSSPPTLQNQAGAPLSLRAVRGEGLPSRPRPSPAWGPALYPLCDLAAAPQVRRSVAPQPAGPACPGACAPADAPAAARSPPAPRLPAAVDAPSVR